MLRTGFGTLYTCYYTACRHAYATRPHVLRRGGLRAGVRAGPGPPSRGASFRGPAPAARGCSAGGPSPFTARSATVCARAALPKPRPNPRLSFRRRGSSVAFLRRGEVNSSKTKTGTHPCTHERPQVRTAQAHAAGFLTSPHCADARRSRPVRHFRPNPLRRTVGDGLPFRVLRMVPIGKLSTTRIPWTHASSRNSPRPEWHGPTCPQHLLDLTRFFAAAHRYNARFKGPGPLF